MKQCSPDDNPMISASARDEAQGKKKLGSLAKKFGESVKLWILG
jgi:hypothetical protein